ncbi:ribonuclease HII [Candidatus Gracilibacteria bacterium]|nr:ribonuclease HII [Candidatus Gracilibacteria bacterium]
MASFQAYESRLKKAGFFYIAGIDEAGRGPMAGPVVSAAVILKDKARLPGLNDSKKLSAAKREELFPKIISNSIAYSITIVSHLTIDEINILNATRLANKLCVQYLRPSPDFVLLDGRDKQFINHPFENIVKGDSKVKSIAAASILAKVTRDRLMQYYAEKYPEYAFQKHMGYGTRQHRKAMEQYGPCSIHRKSYTFK